jgi:hypothetical protein
MRFPGLKVVLIEGGVAWLPPALWRLDKTWRGVRAGDAVADAHADLDRARPYPHDRRSPSTRRRTRRSLLRLMDQIGSDEMLLYASDYPHWHHDDSDALPDGLPADLVAQDDHRQSPRDLSTPRGARHRLTGETEHERHRPRTAPHTARPGRQHLGYVDCDVHPMVKSGADFDPFLSARWVEHRKTIGEPAPRRPVAGDALSAHVPGRRRAHGRLAEAMAGNCRAPTSRFCRSSCSICSTSPTACSRRWWADTRRSATSSSPRPWRPRWMNRQLAHFVDPEPRLKAAVQITIETNSAIEEIEKRAGEPALRAG